MSDFFPYLFAPQARLALRLLGVRPDRDGVRIANGEIEASFGPLNLVVPIDRVVCARVTGPYSWYKALGPRLSLADHGLTFGTSAAGGVCLLFDQPIEPVIGPWTHPGFTVTVNDPAALVALVQSLRS